MTPTLASAAWREGRRLVGPDWGTLVAALLLMAASRAAALALPTGSKYVVDHVIGRQRGDDLWLVAVLIGVAVAIEAGAGFGAMQLAGVASQRACARARRQLQARAIGLPLRCLETSPSSALAAQVMTDSEQVRSLVGNGLVQLLASLVTAALALGILFSINLPLTIAVIAILGVAGLGVRGSFGRIRVGLKAVLRRQSELTGRLSEALSEARVVKAYAAERREAYRFAQESNRLARENLHVQRDLSGISASITIASGVLGLLLLVLGARAVAGGGMSLGDLVLYAWLLGFLLGPVTHVAASAGELGRAMAALTRIAELRALATEAEEDRPYEAARRILGAVDFEDVSYGYVPGRPALQGVSLHAPAGALIALVGANGSGKSTLCHLLLAYDRPSTGRIRIDGQDLATLRRQRYRSCLGVVASDTALFRGTIADNIRYGRPRASLAELHVAAHMAHCDEFVARLPEGYSTLVGERGVRLSSGERQRVAIARAFLTDPRILVLDEATSSLDLNGEHLVQAALRRLFRGRTTFVVTHRVATIRHADQILVLDHGSIVERGVHDELIAARGRYFLLWEAQSRGDSAAPDGTGSENPQRFPVQLRELSGESAGGNGRGHR